MTTSAMTSPLGSRLPHRFQPLRALGSVVFVCAVSGLAGALTPIGERHLPESVSSMANSSGSWTLIAFVAIYLSGLRSWGAAVMGAMSFLVMNAAFDVVFGRYGVEYPHRDLLFWCFIAVAVGPIVGLSAAWLRGGSPALRAVGAAAPSAVLIGEGVYMLVQLPGTSTLYAHASVSVGILLFLGISLFRLRRFSAVVLSAALCGLGATMFFAVYGMLPVVLHKIVP